MKKRLTWAQALLFTIVVGFAATAVCSVRAYKDGWDAGYLEASSKMEAHNSYIQSQSADKLRIYEARIQTLEEELRSATRSCEQIYPGNYSCSSEKDPEDASPTTEDPLPQSFLTEEEIEWLAITIYKEGGGDAVCDECRYCIGDVVLNRLEDPRFPDTLYEVLTQPRQYNTFSWDGIVWPSEAYTEPEQHAVERARAVARDLAYGNHSDLYGEGYIGQAEFVQGNSWFWHCGICFSKW